MVASHRKTKLMASAEIFFGILLGSVFAAAAAVASIRAIHAFLPREEGTLIRPFAVPAVMYGVAAYNGDKPYVAGTIAVMATFRLLFFGLSLLAILMVMKWKEVLEEAVF